MRGAYVFAQGSATAGVPGKGAIRKIVAALLAFLCVATPTADAGALKGKQLEALWAVDGRTRDGTIAAIAACLEKLNTPPKTAPTPELAANTVCASDPMQISFSALSYRPASDQRQTLQSLGRLLNRPEARQIRLRIVGHALCSEISARDPYAMKLTFRRAKSVAELLARAGRVDGDRLIAEGRGYFEPVEGDKSLAAAKPDIEACKVGTTHLANARVEFIIDTPVGLTYGSPAGQYISALGGDDPPPRENQSPRVAAGAAAAAPAAAAAMPPITSPLPRYFPSGLRPGPFHSFSLSRAVAAFRIDPGSVGAAHCAGYRTAWQSLPEISQLDLGAGKIALRLRTVLVRAEDQNRGRDQIELFLDVDGRQSWADDQPAFAGYWAMRERVVLALRLALTGSGYIDQSNQPLARKAGWGSDDNGGTTAAFVSACGFKGAAENASFESWSQAQPAYDQVIAALPATPEDLLARRLDLNPLQGFVALRAGYQLCVAPAGTAVRQERGDISFQLGFSPETCTVVREFAFSTGRTGLTAGGGNWRSARDNTQLPALKGNPSRVVVTRWGDLVDPSQSSRVYLFSARSFLPAYVSAWIEGTLDADQADNTNHADYVVGIRNLPPPTPFDLGLFFADRFRRAVDEACIAGSGSFTVATLPGSYQRLRKADLDPSVANAGLIPTAQTAYTRCATAERFAEITAKLPIWVRDEVAFVPIGTTWGELASEHRASERKLYREASASAAAQALFGERARTATFTQGAARALPVLPGDSIGW